MQFRPVRVECPREELAPEAPDLVERAESVIVAVRRGGKGFCRNGCHDATRCFRSRLGPRRAFFGTETSFGLIY
jgi:hypothetical protein